MNIFNRDRMATTLKLCKSCLRETKEGHERTCIVFKLKNKKNKTDKTKYEFTCRDQTCYRHMWLCSKHKASNQESMDRKASDLDHKHGLKLAHFLGCSRPVPTPAPPCPQAAQPNSSPVPLEQAHGAVSVDPELPAVTTSAFRTAEKK